ncbi:hypothetical protein L6R49_28160 [Myxococcota bacterium]|nr:hypothetical protein [Myxococcota bacterium]
MNDPTRAAAGLYQRDMRREDLDGPARDRAAHHLLRLARGLVEAPGADEALRAAARAWLAEASAHLEQSAADVVGRAEAWLLVLRASSSSLAAQKTAAAHLVALGELWRNDPDASRRELAEGWRAEGYSAQAGLPELGVSRRCA